MKKPLVSIIIATRNRANLLQFSIESAITQTYKNLEIIIIDDASTDNTLSVITDIKKTDDRIRYFRTETNVGPGKARNIGISHALGKFIAILDDDDISLPERIREQVKILEESPHVGLVFSSLAWIDKKGNIYQFFPERNYDISPLDPDQVFRQLYLEEKKIPHVTIMFHKSIFLEIGGYPESIWLGEDRMLLMKMAAKGIKMQYIPNILVKALGDTNHDHLTQNSSSVLTSKRIIFDEINRWLKSEKINRFDNLHHLALSNLLVREARAISGLRGLFLCLHACLLNPKNDFALETFIWFFNKVKNKFFS